jgi:hypothetical protein
MQKVGNTLVDISGNGRNITVPNNYFNSKEGLTSVNKNSSSASNDLTASGVTATDWTYALQHNGINQANACIFNKIIYCGIISSAILNYYDGSVKPFSPTIPIANIVKKGSVVFTYTDSTKLLSCYINGVFAGSATLVIAIGATAFGSIFNVSGYGGVQYTGELQDLRIYNRVLTLQEIKDYNNSFIQPTLLEDYSDAGADNQVSVPREWTKTSGTFKVAENVIRQGEFTPGGPNWSSNVGWVLSGATILGGVYTGTSVGLNYNNSPNFPLVVGKRYKIIVNVLTCSNLGTAKVYVGGKQFVLAVGLNQFDVVADTINQFIGFNDFIGTSNYYSITEIQPLQTITNGTKYLECASDGVITTSSNTAYGSWEFDWYKGADGNGIRLNFIQSSASLYTTGAGYMLDIYPDESITLYRFLNGAATPLLITSASYITNNTWYRMRITRTTTGLFTVLIKGGTFAPTAGYSGWTLLGVTGGSNPVTDNTYTTSNYLVMILKGLDRVTNIKITNGLSSLAIPSTWLYGDNVLSQFWGDNLGLELWGDNL